MNEHCILCVDDEQNILQAMKRLLRREPYTLLTASTPDEAFSLLSAHKVRVVISDQRMPAMSGTELLTRVKELYPDTIRIVFSGYADLATIADAVNKGQIYRFLAKPWDDEDLKLTIRQCLKQYELAERNHLLAERIKAQNEELTRLNEQLSEAIAERTRVLDVSREMLACLPNPVIGISREGTVVFINEALGRMAAPFNRIALGDDAKSFLPAGLATRVEQNMHGDPAPTDWVEKIDDREIRFQLRRIHEGINTVGCLVVIHIPEVDGSNETRSREPITDSAEGIASAIREVPPLPAAAQRLCAMADQPDADMRDMAMIITADAALTARILRVANSAFYGLSRRIATVPHAISILGMHSVRNIALAASVFGYGQGAAPPFDMTAFWKHCAAVATAARQIARLLKLKDPEEAFVGGLLHDIGRVVLASHWRERYTEVLLQARQSGEPLAAVETELLGSNSAEVGRMLCEHWQLPETLCEVVARHHDDVAAVDSGGVNDARMFLAVAAANSLAKLAGIGDSGNQKVDTRFIEALHVRGIDAETLDRIVLDLPEAVREIEALFDLPAKGGAR
jgi:putative nucleotidyltransferase with HDIG domain